MSFLNFESARGTKYREYGISVRVSVCDFLVTSDYLEDVDRFWFLLKTLL